MLQQPSVGTGPQTVGAEVVTDLSMLGTVLGLAAAHGFQRDVIAGQGLCRALATSDGAAFLFWQHTVDLPPTELAASRGLSRTRLMAASSRGDAKRVRVMLRAGADVSAVDAHGFNAVHWAVRGGSVSALCALLAHRGEAAGGAFSAARALARLHTALAAGDKANNTPLHLAATRGAAGSGALRALLAAGARADAVNVLGTTPLMMALRAADCISGDDGAVTALLAAPHARATLSARDFTGWTPTALAAFLGSTDALERLAAAGARVVGDVSNDGRSPLHHAATKGHVDAARWLLRRGVPVDARDGAGATPLADAAFAGHAQVVQLLLSSGANVCARDDFGKSAFDKAESLGAGHMPVLMLLRAAGAD